MDDRVRKAVYGKIDEALAESSQAIALVNVVMPLNENCAADLAIGIVIGRIFNSFHYQTRRILGRNATAQEFDEFVKLIQTKSD